MENNIKWNKKSPGRLSTHRLKQYTHGQKRQCFIQPAGFWLSNTHWGPRWERKCLFLYINILHTLLCARSGVEKTIHSFMLGTSLCAFPGCKNVQIHPKICSSFLLPLISCCLFTHAPVCIESWDTNTRCICVSLSRQLYYKTRFLSLTLHDTALCWEKRTRRQSDFDAVARLLEILEGDN